MGFMQNWLEKRWEANARQTELEFINGAKFDRDGKKIKQKEADSDADESHVKAGGGRGSVYASGYSDSGASHTKRALKGWTGTSSSPQEDIDENNGTLRQRGRLLFMSSPLAAAPINTYRTKVVGSGLKMRAAIQYELLGMTAEAAQEWNKRTEAEFRLWAEKKDNCDALGINNLYQMEQLAILQWFMSGDVFCLIQRDDATPLNPYTLRLHMIEADRVSTPCTAGVRYIAGTAGKAKNGNDIYDGVEVNSRGKVVAYHICSCYPGEITTKKVEWTRVEAVGAKTGLPNILHVRSAERCEQYRGVTILAPVIELLQNQKRFTESQLMAALIQSFLTAWIETELPATDYPFNEARPGEYEADDSDERREWHDPNEHEIGPGTVNVLNPGEKVVLGNPQVPTEGFDVFIKNLAMQLGAALEIPRDVLLKEFNASYSASRGALEEAWEAVKMYRSWFETDFCQPIYEIWLAEAVAIGRIKAPGFFRDPLIRAAWSHARWDGPSQTHLDPVKEANANEILARNGWKTNTQITRESYGGDWNENMNQLAQEQERLRQLFPEPAAGNGTDQSDDEESPEKERG